MNFNKKEMLALLNVVRRTNHIICFTVHTLLAHVCCLIHFNLVPILSLCASAESVGVLHGAGTSSILLEYFTERPREWELRPVLEFSELCNLFHNARPSIEIPCEISSPATITLPMRFGEKIVWLSQETRWNEAWGSVSSLQNSTLCGELKKCCNTNKLIYLTCYSYFYRYFVISEIPVYLTQVPYMNWKNLIGIFRDNRWMHIIMSWKGFLNDSF